jgi:hypothetical protein
MTSETKERWMEFCEQAAKEPDPEKLIALVEEINRLLQEKQDRINGRNAPAQSLRMVLGSYFNWNCGCSATLLQ